MPDDYRRDRGDDEVAADRIEEVGEKLANVNATIADQISWVRAGLEAGELPDVNEPPSKAELRAVKLATAEIVASYAELVRGEAERFSDLAASRIGAIEASEQSECARFQIGYSRSALVAGLLKSLSHLERLFPAGEIAVNAYTDPKIFACWLQD